MIKKPVSSINRNPFRLESRDLKPVKKINRFPTLAYNYEHIRKIGSVFTVVWLCCASASWFTSCSRSFCFRLDSSSSALVSLSWRSRVAILARATRSMLSAEVTTSFRASRADFSLDNSSHIACNGSDDRTDQSMSIIRCLNSNNSDQYYRRSIGVFCSVTHSTNTVLCSLCCLYVRLRFKRFVFNLVNNPKI